MGNGVLLHWMQVRPRESHLPSVSCSQIAAGDLSSAEIHVFAAILQNWLVASANDSPVFPVTTLKPSPRRWQAFIAWSWLKPLLLASLYAYSSSRCTCGGMSPPFRPPDTTVSSFAVSVLMNRLLYLPRESGNTPGNFKKRGRMLAPKQGCQWASTVPRLE